MRKRSKEYDHIYGTKSDAVQREGRNVEGNQLENLAEILDCQRNGGECGEQADYHRQNILLILSMKPNQYLNVMRRGNELADGTKIMNNQVGEIMNGLIHMTQIRT